MKKKEQTENILTVTDDQKKAIDERTGSVSNFIDKTRSLVIDNGAAETKAVAILADGERFIDELEKKRKEIVSPADKFVRHINSMFRPLRTAVEDACQTVRDKLGRYDQLRRAEDREHAEVPTDVTVTAGASNLQYRKVWTFEIEDEEKVERQFCSSDPKKIQAFVDAGLRTAAGIRIFMRSVPVLRNNAS